MNKAVLLSLQPKWCELIASGKKTVEVRKTRPKLETPFKVYIYCTKDKKNKFFSPLTQQMFKLPPKDYVVDTRGNGKVIGEFVCCRIEEIKQNEVFNANVLCSTTCLTIKEFLDYIGNKTAYCWHISNLVIYDKPKELEEFKQCHKCEYYANCFEHEYSCDGVYNLTRPPQSWCYVEELK